MAVTINNGKESVSTNNQIPVLRNIYSQGINLGTDYLGNLGGQFFGNDTELGRSMGTLFSSGLSATGNTIANNVLKGQAFTSGLGQNVGSSVGGAASGLAANYIGKGITSAMGDNYAGRAVGAGVSTALGTVGGAATNALMTGSSIASGISSINPIALGANVLGAALSAGNGPSKEYGGKYGGVTQGMDLAYDAAMIGVNAIPGFGQLISGAMALNKGLNNVFGSTSGMTLQDSLLGSSFSPFYWKWINMAAAKTTDSFKNQSWQNSEKTKSFMGNAFGNLQSKFDKAREEAGKTYGTFSRGAYNKAQNNIQFANQAWDKILAMADQNEWQNIRSQYMSSINNQRYAQNIQGGYSPIVRGKLGMKIFNNATNHNIGQRLLSAAALIDNKAMILCSAVD